MKLPIFRSLVVALLFNFVEPMTVLALDDFDPCHSEIVLFSDTACSRVKSSLQARRSNFDFEFGLRSVSEQPFSCEMYMALEEVFSTMRPRFDANRPVSIAAQDFARRYFALHSRSAEAGTSLLTVTATPRRCLDRSYVIVVGLKGNASILEGISGCNSEKIDLLVGIDDICFGRAMILTFEGLETLGGLLEDAVDDLRVYVQVERLDQIEGFQPSAPRQVYRNRWTDLDGLSK